MINYDPSTFEFYEGKPALDNKRDKNILTGEELYSYAVGDWVLVIYDGYSPGYPGEITEVDESSLQMKVMEKAGGNFKWSKREDKIYYAMENVYKSLNHPIVVENTGQIKFTMYEQHHRMVSLFYNETNKINKTNKI